MRGAERRDLAVAAPRRLSIAAAWPSPPAWADDARGELPHGALGRAGRAAESHDAPRLRRGADLVRGSGAYAGAGAARAAAARHLRRGGAVGGAGQDARARAVAA